MDKDKALKLALEFVENVHLGECQGSIERQEEIVTAINKALAQPAQKPVAWLYEGEYSSGSYSGNYFAWNVTMNKHATNAARKVKPLYTAPQQRPWVGITDEEMESIFLQCGGKWNGDYWKIEDADFHPFLRTIETKLKKNT